ncbi:hypothetical protein TVAG_267190 [Trichomonas vaginalis G3]|uniref:Inner centromere protein ARK-binding domain-containing protein n=1 Tax=Trichomonas vaginalis (strain ATCC PRA-98 / G3) TaxID=412133 RepID=A2F557_TRIV3|nr:inner centromere protein, ARK binding region-containing protein [Trichomonas vaginalis G3]EAX99950.1 hypothetical protein TVAG_267190 [Trichomonas vaginalis G3]KAI5516709.1 inner centromere protein, ARK binding region-containing protein [Trichomonas vaginalis G3]|eukprot:XP_001312880.1 hypothetical protein [Trichomonas vaginalis G3]
MTSGVEAEVQEQLNWMQSLLSTPSTNDAASASKNKYQSQIDDLLSSIDCPAQPKSRSFQDSYTDLEIEPRPSYEPSFLTGAVPPPKEVQYRISDPVDSDYDSDCEEYYVEDAEEIRGQEIPSWARAANLIQELEKQKGVDPDKIFVGFDTSCDLNAMFEKKKKTFKVRGDSGWWAADTVTPDEEAKYKKALGLV